LSHEAKSDIPLFERSSLIPSSIAGSRSLRSLAAVSFLGQWLSLRLSTLLYENYIIFIVIGAAIGFGVGINLILEIVK
jgi:hypothetical protein